MERGSAEDWRARNRVARDFCRTLPATGCGFYPRSVFIHMDTRSESAAGGRSVQGTSHA